MTEPPVFDRAALDQMAQTVDPDFAREIAELYLAQLDELAAAVESGVRSNDDGAVRRAAHSLKSSSGQVGALRLSALCQRVETGQAGDPEDIITELNRLVKATQTALEAEW